MVLPRTNRQFNKAMMEGVIRANTIPNLTVMKVRAEWVPVDGQESSFDVMIGIPGELHVFELDAGAAITSKVANSWTHYKGDYPTGNGGHGSGGGVGQTEFIIQLAGADYFFNIGPGVLIVEHRPTSTSATLQPGQFVIVDANGVGAPMSIAQNPNAQQFVNDVLAEVATH